jgi:hypothetical protein
MAGHAGIRRPMTGVSMQTMIRPAGSGARMRPSAVTAAATGGQAEGGPGGKTSSDYRGVSWNKGRSAWAAILWNPQTKRTQHIGLYVSEEDAARAYDCAAVKLHGPDWPRRNFPDELNEPPT